MGFVLNEEGGEVILFLVLQTPVGGVERKIKIVELEVSSSFSVNFLLIIGLPNWAQHLKKVN